LGGTIYDLVINVSEVLHILDFMASESQITPDYIEDYVSHGMPDMTFVISSNATDIHGYHSVAVMKIFLLPG
jgi:hypothetical protein